MLDAARLQTGFRSLRQTDPSRAGRVGSRMLTYRARLAADYPGDPESGVLGEDDASQERFDSFANDEVCPVLDPLTGTCDLYAARPVTCRIFGPPVRQDGGLGLCELCFQHATKAEIAAAEMFLPDPTIEAALTEPLGHATTTIGFCLDVTEATGAMLKA